MTSRKAFKYRGTKCLNCETQLDKSERYCHYCGQLNSTKKLTIRDFIDEFFANFYAYDSRLRNTLLFLFTKPGTAAKEFVYGKRNKHANPFRLFLSAAILLFILIKFLDDTNLETKNKVVLDQAFYKNDTLPKESNETKRTINTTDSIIKKEKVFYRDSIYLDKDFNKVTNDFEEFTLRLSSMRNFYLKNENMETELALKKLGYENKRLYRIMYDKSKSLKSNDIGREIIDFFMSNFPFLLFLAIPLIAVMFWFVYFNKNLNYTDHLVFTYYFYTFMLVVLVLFTLIDIIDTDVSNLFVSMSFVFIFPIYLYKSLRNFYSQNRWITFFKFILLNILFIPISFITVLILFFISLILF